MPRPLTKDEIVAARGRLSQWAEPESFRHLVNELHSKVGSKDFFNRPALSFLQDAWVISEFVLARKVDRVRLSTEREQWPDGFIEAAGAIERLEVTEVLEPGRRRGDEFKSDSTSVEHDPVEDWIKRADQLADALESVVKRKVARRYSEPALLLVYLNIGEWGIRQARCEQAIRLIKSKYAPSFSDVLILWKDKWF